MVSRRATRLCSMPEQGAYEMEDGRVDLSLELLATEVHGEGAFSGVRSALRNCENASVHCGSVS
jgi:hypothetical protein